MKKVLVSLSSITILGLGSTLMADDAFTNYAVSLKAGTLGAGVEVTTNIVDDLNLRLGANGYKYSMDGEESGIYYNADLELQTFSLLADYHAFGGSFRITGGAVINNNELTMTGKPSVGGIFEINGVTYTTSDVGTVDARVDFDNVVPYLGIGWGNAVKSAGWNFTADLGVIFQGKPNSYITTTTTLTGAAKDTLDANVAAEKKELDDSLDSFEYYPVATIGISYGF